MKGETKVKSLKPKTKSLERDQEERKKEKFPPFDC
jgi:hypothetical protein